MVYFMRPSDGASNPECSVHRRWPYIGMLGRQLVTLELVEPSVGRLPKGVADIRLHLRTLVGTSPRRD